MIDLIFLSLLPPHRNETNGQEIYMYDIGTRIVSRLKGELSSAFVNVAESNANAQDDDMNSNNVTLTDSGIYEKMPAMDAEKEKITIVQAQSSSSSAATTTSTFGSQQQQQHNQPIFRRLDDKQSQPATSSSTKLSISSGYSVIKR